MAALAGLTMLDSVPFESSAGWWRAVSRAAIPKGHRPRFLLAREDGTPALLLPLLVRGDTGARGESFTTPYTCLFQPPCAPTAALQALGGALAPCLPSLLRVDGIDPAWPGWQPLLSGLRRGGRRVAAFASFASWCEPLRGRSWAEYLADRPGALRTTIRRRLGQAERDDRTTIAMVPTADAAAGLAEFESVHARSWKAAEPHPGFASAFVAEAAAAGVLRIAVLRREGLPLAAQYWTVERGLATVHKLAHDETARGLSPGTVLTAWMIRRLIVEERVETLDFGRGDDSYKQLWAGERRQRGGLVVADPRHPLGAAALLLQATGRLARWWRS